MGLTGSSRVKMTAAVAASLVAIALILGSCGGGGSGPGGFKTASVEDYSGLSWTEAFEKMHEKISREYAFTEWRGIDWKAIHDEFEPLVAAAEKKNSVEDYYVALRQYICAPRDGHMKIEGKDLGLNDKLYGGGYGLTLEQLDDGGVIANWVKEGGPAASAGMKAGARIDRWGGKPVDTALRETETFMSLYPPTTDEMLGVVQRYFLARGPAGGRQEVAFTNPGGAAPATATLGATRDDYESLRHTYSLVGFQPEENKDGVTRMVVSKTLPGGFGYVKIEGEYDLPSNLKGDHTPTMDLYRDAIKGFIDSKAPGLVLDVRSNDGGSDEMVADMMSSLFAEDSFYEYQNWFNASTGRMEIILVNEKSGTFEKPGQGIKIEPGSTRFQGPVVALVNPACISSGEGIAMCVDRLPAGEVVGFRGTNGSFGMVYGALVKMPEGYSITYPIGQSLDSRKKVQVESRQGQGGVTPGKRVPLDADNAVRAGGGEDVELEYAQRILQETAAR